MFFNDFVGRSIFASRDFLLDVLYRLVLLIFAHRYVYCHIFEFNVLYIYINIHRYRYANVIQHRERDNGLSVDGQATRTCTLSRLCVYLYIHVDVFEIHAYCGLPCRSSVRPRNINIVLKEAGIFL